MTRLAWLAALAVLATPAFANAKPMPPPEPPPASDDYEPPPPPVHDGEPPPTASPEPESKYRQTTWFAGFGLGVRTISYQDTEESYGGGMFTAHLGGMLTERIGMLIWLGTDSHKLDTFDEGTAMLSVFGLAGMYRATPRLWLRAGLGTGEWVLRQDGTELDALKARMFTFGVGYEVWSRKSMAVDLEVRFMSTTVDPNGIDGSRGGLAFLANLTWY
jgi:hypothetical protein